MLYQKKTDIQFLGKCLSQNAAGFQVENPFLKICIKMKILKYGDKNG